MTKKYLKAHLKRTNEQTNDRKVAIQIKYVRGYLRKKRPHLYRRQKITHMCHINDRWCQVKAQFSLNGDIDVVVDRRVVACMKTTTTDQQHRRGGYLETHTHNFVSSFTSAIASRI